MSSDVETERALPGIAGRAPILATALRARSAEPATGMALPRRSASPRDAESLLIAGLRRRDDAAFEELVRTRGRQMHTVARRYLPCEADADDALQDAFVSIVRSIDGFTGQCRLSTWLHRIVVNSALMRLRTRRRRPEFRALDAGIEGTAVAASSRSDASADEAVEAQELRLRVRRGIDRLPETQRLAVLLRDIDGLEMAEIARLVGTEVSTVKMRLHRGRRALAEVLVQDGAQL